MATKDKKKEKRKNKKKNRKKFDSTMEETLHARHTDGGFLRFVKMIVMAIKRFSEPYYNGFAGQISFYLCLSIVPMLMVITQILTALNIIPIDTILEMVKEYSGDNVPEVVKNLLTSQMTISSNIVFIVLSCWAASKAQFAISRVANYTLSNGKTTGKGYFADRFRAVLTMLITIFAICLALLILIFGKQILEIVANLFNQTFMLETDVTKVILWLRWPAFMIIFILILSINYYIMPTIHVKFRDVIPGAILSAIGMIIVSLIFSKYLATAGNYNIIYGSLASIAALLMWFYFLAWAIGVGVMCNKLIAETRPDYVEQRWQERKRARKERRKKGRAYREITDEIPHETLRRVQEEEAYEAQDKKQGEIKEEGPGEAQDKADGIGHDEVQNDAENEAKNESEEAEAYKDKLKEDIKEMLVEEVETRGLPKKMKAKVLNRLQEEKPAEEKTTQEKPADEKTTEEKLTEEKPAKEKVTDKQK